MDIKQVISMFLDENITVDLQDNNLIVTPKNLLNEADIYFLKLHREEIIAYLVDVKNQPVSLVNSYSQRQCLSCNYWAHDRCNLPLHIGRDDWGRLFYYTPNPNIWMRCKHHTGETKNINKSE